MSELNFEQRIADEVNKQLNSGMVEKLIAEKLESGIAESLNDVFRYSGVGKKAIDEKINEIMVPVIERHDFNQYVVKLDDCLTEIVNATNLVDNKKILENFKDLMKEPDVKEIKLSQIFEKYCDRVAKDVDTSDLEANCEDGEPYYDNVDACIEVEHEDKWLKSSYDYCKVKFSCEQDGEMNCEIRLYKNSEDTKWQFFSSSAEISILSLRNLDSFQILLSKLQRSFVKIEMDIEDALTEVELEQKPEWDLV